MTRALALVVATSAVVLSCGTSAPDSCPAVADQCPDGCREFTAWAYDEPAACLRGPVTVGCTNSTQGGAWVIDCYQRTVDGALFLFMSSPPFGPPDWSGCSDEEDAKVKPAAPCQ